MNLLSRISVRERVLLGVFAALSALAVFFGANVGLALLYVLFLVYAFRYNGWRGALVVFGLLVYFDFVFVDDPAAIASILTRVSGWPAWVVRFIIPNLLLFIIALASPKKGLLERITFGGK